MNFFKKKMLSNYLSPTENAKKCKQCRQCGKGKSVLTLETFKTSGNVGEFFLYFFAAMNLVNKYLLIRIITIFHPISNLFY